MNSNYKKNCPQKDVLVLKNKSKEDCNVFATRTSKMVKESILCQYSGGKTVYSNPGLDLHQVQGKNEITTKGL